MPAFPTCLPHTFPSHFFATVAVCRGGEGRVLTGNIPGVVVYARWYAPLSELSRRRSLKLNCSAAGVHRTLNTIFYFYSTATCLRHELCETAWQRRNGVS